MGGRGATKRGGGGWGVGGGAGKFYPYAKGGGGLTSFSHAEGGGGFTKSFGVVFIRQLEVLAILNGGGGTKRFHPFKRGGGGVCPVLTGAAQKVSELRFSHCVAPFSS